MSREASSRQCGMRKSGTDYIIWSLLHRDRHGAWGWGGKHIAPRKTGETETQIIKLKLSRDTMYED